MIQTRKTMIVSVVAIIALSLVVNSNSSFAKVKPVCPAEKLIKAEEEKGLKLHITFMQYLAAYKDPTVPSRNKASKWDTYIRIKTVYESDLIRYDLVMKNRNCLVGIDIFRVKRELAKTNEKMWVVRDRETRYKKDPQFTWWDFEFETNPKSINFEYPHYYSVFEPLRALD